jgi:hypothetical protein
MPKWYKLRGKKLYRWGHYTRTLVLYSGAKVKVRVQRFYCPEERRTISLLPFYITRYQRYINTIIEDVLKKVLIDMSSADKVEMAGPPLGKTIRRWAKWMLANLEQMRVGAAKLLIRRDAEYFSVGAAKGTAAGKFADLLEKGSRLASEEDIMQYGALSYIMCGLEGNA